MTTSLAPPGELEHDCRAVLQASPEGVWLFDSQGRLLEVNETYLTMSGGVRAELLGRAISTLMADVPEETVLERIRATREQGSSRFAVRLLRDNGNRFAADAVFHAMPDDPDRYFGFLRDRDGGAGLLRALGARQGYFELDLRNHALLVDDTFVLLLGIAPGGRPLTSLESWLAQVQPDDRAGVAEALLAHGEPETSRALFEYRVHAADGECKWMQVSCNVVEWAPDDQPLRLQGVQTDVSLLREQQFNLERLAHYDPLTKLPNRVLLADRMRLALAHSQRTQDLLAVCFLDLDGFKPINDTLGHKAGDQLLREVAQRLRENIRGEDTAARLGGDEFALLLGELKSIRECELALGRVLTALAMPYTVNGQTVRVSASIGVTLYPLDGADPDLLLRHADHAMYLAKQAGKNRYHLFDTDQEHKARANRGVLTRIEKGLAAGQFSLHYQPKVDCRRGRVVGLEALIRWRHPILGMIAPSEYLPLIEHEDLSIRLGEWVFRAALEQLATWRQEGLALPVSVNISARQLHRMDFVASLRAILADYPAEVAQLLEVEIVETAALEDVNAVGDTIRECGELGIGFALDDFGTGYSSLVYLRRLPARFLKIDRAFIAGMLDDMGDMAIVEGVIGLAAAFRRDVVAEGVESIDQILMLMELGCDVMQGYAIARPMAAEQAAAWLRAFQPDPRWRLAATPRPSRHDFELMLAEANHRHWVERILNYVEQENPAAEPPPLDSRACRFGQWYHGDGMSFYGANPRFQAIDPLHETIHRLGHVVVARCRAGDFDAARVTAIEISALREDLVALIRQVRAGLLQDAAGRIAKPGSP